MKHWLSSPTGLGNATDTGTIEVMWCWWDGSFQVLLVTTFGAKRISNASVDFFQEAVARYVSMIPSVSDSVVFPGMCDIWSTCDVSLRGLRWGFVILWGAPTLNLYCLHCSNFCPCYKEMKRNMPFYWPTTSCTWGWMPGSCWVRSCYTAGFITELKFSRLSGSQRAYWVFSKAKKKNSWLLVLLSYKKGLEGKLLVFFEAQEEWKKFYRSAWNHHNFSKIHDSDHDYMNIWTLNSHSKTKVRSTTRCAIPITTCDFVWAEKRRTQGSRHDVCGDKKLLFFGLIWSLQPTCCQPIISTVGDVYADRCRFSRGAPTRACLDPLWSTHWQIKMRQHACCPCNLKNKWLASSLHVCTSCMMWATAVRNSHTMSIGLA